MKTLFSRFTNSLMFRVEHQIINPGDSRLAPLAPRVGIYGMNFVDIKEEHMGKPHNN